MMVAHCDVCKVNVARVRVAKCYSQDDPLYSQMNINKYASIPTATDFCSDCLLGKKITKG